MAGWPQWRRWDHRGTGAKWVNGSGAVTLSFFIWGWFKSCLHLFCLVRWEIYENILQHEDLLLDLKLTRLTEDKVWSLLKGAEFVCWDPGACPGHVPNHRDSWQFWQSVLLVPFEFQKFVELTKKDVKPMQDVSVLMKWKQRMPHAASFQSCRAAELQTCHPFSGGSWVDFIALCGPAIGHERLDLGKK